ncbi:MAG: methyltransferase, partial [Pseudomonadota bacterium]|nr:methyltransferase [Pseudomonadota bacterium]
GHCPKHTTFIAIGAFSTSPGGTGSWLAAIINRFGDLDGTLFELPAAAAVARKNLADVDGGGRIEMVDGDFIKDPLPGRHDVILIANVMHLFSPENNQALLRSARDSVADGVRLLLADFWTDDTIRSRTLRR